MLSLHRFYIRLFIAAALLVAPQISFSQSENVLVRDFLSSLPSEPHPPTLTTGSPDSLTNPLALRISKDLSNRQLQLENLPWSLSSLPTIKKMWEENKSLRSSIRSEFQNANVRDQFSGEIITAQYFLFLRINFLALTHLTRIQIEQFSMERDDGNAMVMSLEFLDRDLPPAWSVEAKELKRLWAEKRSELNRQKVAAKQQQKEQAARESKVRDDNLPKIIQKHQAKITSLNLGADFLKAIPLINIAGKEVTYRPFNEWVALLLENPNVEEIAPISLPRSRSKGIRIKVKGHPSLGILFSHEGKDLFMTHVTDRENASPIRTLSEKMATTRVMMRLAGDIND